MTLLTLPCLAGPVALLWLALRTGEENLRAVEELDLEPCAEHESYDRLNAVLRGRVAAGAGRPGQNFWTGGGFFAQQKKPGPQKEDPALTVRFTRRFGGQSGDMPHRLPILKLA